MATHGEILSRREDAAAVAQKHRDCTAGIVGNDQVGYSVVVDVGTGDCDRTHAYRKGQSRYKYRRECRRAKITEDCHSTVIGVRHSQVGSRDRNTADDRVEIPRDDSDRMRSCRENHWLHEISLAVPQHDRNIIAVKVRDSEIQMAVAIEIGNGDARRQITIRAKVVGVIEGPAPLKVPSPLPRRIETPPPIWPEKRPPSAEKNPVGMVVTAISG